MKYGLVVIGASLGGLEALRTVLSALPAAFPLPLAVVQHRTENAGDSLRVALAGSCALPIVEAGDKLPITAGAVFIAPPGYHLLVEEGHWALSTEGPVLFARPSINVLFETAAEAFGRRAIGVILSGSSGDGADGLAAIDRCGGVALIQSPATALAETMPQAALNALPGVTALGLWEIGPRLVALGMGG